MHDFSMGLNESLKQYNYPLPNPEEIFAKLNYGKFFLSWIFWTFTYKYKCAQNY